ncbi:MAG: TonB-dependent receptor, partial [Rhodospirillaceae bacterium]|nr:TonB-dependent receptor [Rhodospirillaceae bacterium]
MSSKGEIAARAVLTGVSLAVLVSSGAWGQSATPGSTIRLAPVIVQGSALSAEEEARERLEAIPGGTALVSASDLDAKANLTAGDALSNVHGLVVQSYFGGNDQPRIQIRGSGLQQNPSQRGILILQDGLPINQADGSYIVGLADFRQAEAIEVYRGYTANRLGATTLGGALNLISPTGSSNPGSIVGLEGGSFGQINTALQTGGKSGNLDGLVQFSSASRSGYRDYNDSDRINFNANVGAELNDAVTTRFFAGYTDLDFDVAGPVPKSWLKDRSRESYTGPNPALGNGPGPNVLRDRPYRETSQFRIGNRTSATYGAHLLDAALGYARTEDSFRYPVSTGVQDTDSDDLTLVLRYAYAPDASQPLPLFDSSVRYVVGSADRRYYLNKKGNKGALFGKNDLDSTTLSANTGFNLPLAERITLSPALTASYASRDNDDRYGAATRPVYDADGGGMASKTAADTGYSRDYSALSPSLGLSWRPNDDHMLFGAISRNFEPPTHDDLLATKGGTPDISPTGFTTTDLDAQTGTTVEIGWRGRAGIVDFDAGTYYSWIKDEILSLRDATNAPLGAMNADKTRHFGIEIGGTARLADDLSLRLAYTFQDFRFHDDPVRGDNYLAGAPRHLINSVVHYDITPRLFVETEVKWSPTKVPVDNMNTLYASPFAIVGLRSSFALTETVSIYGEARNIFD